MCQDGLDILMLFSHLKSIIMLLSGTKDGKVKNMWCYNVLSQHKMPVYLNVWEVKGITWQSINAPYIQHNVQ